MSEMTEPRGADSGGPRSEQPTRRAMLLRLATLLNAGVALLFAIPVLGYLLAPALRRTYLSWIVLGPVEKFPPGQTLLASYRNPFVKPWDGSTADIPCWVRRLSQDEFQIFAINCTHLGCPVRWFQESQLFMCPCHGGVYYADGRRASGPPPRPLYRYPYKIKNGQLWVQAGELPTLGQARV